MVGYRSRTTKPTTALWALVVAALAVATGGVLLVGLTALLIVAVIGGFTTRSPLSPRPVPVIARREFRGQRN